MQVHELQFSEHYNNYDCVKMPEQHYTICGILPQGMASLERFVDIIPVQ